jgi:putative endonuclease
MTGWMYILECCDGTYYTGSTNNLGFRFIQHQNGLGANYTKARRPLKLVYSEIFPSVAKAFYREKQVQGWSKKKKSALIRGDVSGLVQFSKSKNK